MPPPIERIFLHFFDVHFLEEVVGTHKNERWVRDEATLATRLALLAAHEVLVPAASYFEQELCRTTIDLLEPIFETGAVVLVGGGSSAQEYLTSKLDQYRLESNQHRSYLAAVRGIAHHPPFRSRQRSTTSDLVVFWNDTLEMPGFPSFVFGDVSLPSNLEREWASVPERLGREAFIVDYVQPLLPLNQDNMVIRNRLHGVINQGYVASYARELGAGLVSEMVYLGAGHTLMSGATDLPYKRLREALRKRDALRRVVTAGPAQLLELREDPQVIASLLEALADASGNPFEERQLQLAVAVPQDLDSLFRAILRIRSGKADATRYHRAVERLLTAVFSHSLADPRVEEKVDGGTRRIDILYRNLAYTGFFRWIHQRVGANYIVAECKNYAADLTNKELDQVAGYFAPWRTRFGLLVCRSLRNRRLMIERARYAAKADRGIIVVLEDQDLEQLSKAGMDPHWASHQSRYLARRVDELLIEP